MSDNDIPPYAKRLRTAREQIGKSVEEMAALVGLNVPSYYDLESYADEVLSSLSIREFARLCKLLKISPRDLFAEECQTEQDGTVVNSLAAKIRSYMETQEITLAEFEERVGWDVGAFLESPIEIVTDRYNLEALIDIGKEVRFNWVSALRGIISEFDKADV